MTAPRVLILASALDSSPRHVILDRAMTVGEVIAREKVSLDLPTIAVLTDPAGRSAPILRGEWHVRQVTEGYQLSFVPVPGRGSLGSILAAVASIALAVFAPWAAGAIAGMMGLTGTALTIGTSLIGAGIMIAGQFIINRLMPRQSAGPAAETVYTAKASSNRAMPFEPIPELFGRLRYPPPYAARPYAEFDGNDQYLYQLHCLSAGTVNPERWEIGDTLVWTAADGFQGSFAGGDTEIEIIRPGDQVTLFPANVVTAPTVDGQQVPDSPGVLGPFAVNPPGTQITRIACDYVFPLGLVSINKKGNGVSLSRTVYAEYREIDDAGNPVGRGRNCSPSRTRRLPGRRSGRRRAATFRPGAMRSGSARPEPTSRTRPADRRTTSTGCCGPAFAAMSPTSRRRRTARWSPRRSGRPSICPVKLPANTCSRLSACCRRGARAAAGQRRP